MKKIVIIGSSGAGKSTFAQALGHTLDIPVFHLDRHFWDQNWKEYSLEERMAIEQRFIKHYAQWIIEGSYLGSANNRMNAADTIIFLDIPFPLCLWRALTRHIKYRGRERCDIPQGCTDNIDLYRIWKIVKYRYTERKSLLAKLQAIEASEADDLQRKTIIRLCSKTQVEAFLQQSAVERQEDVAFTELQLACV